MKNKVIITVVIIFLLMSAVNSLRLYFAERQENIRLNSNFRAAMSGMDFYKTKAGKDAARSEVLQLRYHEAAQFYPELARAVDDLKIKFKRVQSITETQIVLEKEIVTVLRDSLIFDTIIRQSFAYTDGYNHFQGYLQGDTISARFTAYDSIIQVLHKGRREHPLKIWQPRPIMQTITNQNPALKIKYSKTLQITKP